MSVPFGSLYVGLGWMGPSDVPQHWVCRVGEATRTVSMLATGSTDVLLFELSKYFSV